jgi:bifunctional non-homologous end joining protein LigD
MKSTAKKSEATKSQPTKSEAAKSDAKRPGTMKPETSDPDAAADALARYRAKRDFRITNEPDAGPSARRRGTRASGQTDGPSFVVQKHDARRLHYDFRLELDGVLLSWAVPKGPCFDPKVKRLAVHTEDHPLDYGGFEGTIPEKQYGAGRVVIWDRGTWEPVNDPRAGMKEGKLVFRLHGEKLAGDWELIRTGKQDARQEQWLLFKKRDQWARSLDDYDVIAALPDSVIARPLGPVESREPREPPEPAVPSTAGRSRSTSRPAPSNDPDLSAARRAPLPKALQPQLATLVIRPPAADGWLIEPKLDGYRLLARIDGDDIRLFTRSGLDWSDKMPELVQALGQLDVGRAWLDGEIVVFGDRQLPDFGRLQDALARRRTAPIVYFVFDLPYLEGADLRAVPLWSRRLALSRLLADREPDPERLRLCDSFDQPPARMLAAADQLELEGLMLKRFDAPYVSARTDTWLKLKRQARQELVIVGYRLRAGSAGEVGALLLGYHEDGKLRAAGSVGTGWDAATARDLLKTLEPLEREVPAVDPKTIEAGLMTRGRASLTRWVEPTQVAEIAFTGWTRDGHVRHAVFQGLRADTTADTVVRERPRDGGDDPVVAVSVPTGDKAIGAKTTGAKTTGEKTTGAKTTHNATTNDATADGATIDAVNDGAATGAASKTNASASRASSKRSTTRGARRGPVARNGDGQPPPPDRARSGKDRIRRRRADGSDPRTDAAGADDRNVDAKGDRATGRTRLTNPDRVIDPSTGLTKRDLYRYYESVADFILPHLVARPVALVRAPDGIAGQTFFQKHLFARMPGVTQLDPDLWPDHQPMMAIESVEALLSAAQMNCIELHTWNATTRAIDQPDRIVFDLDPGEGIGLPEIKEGSRLVQGLLAELGLEAWVKTSGGKGLHVVVPIAPRLSADEVKAFSKDVVEHLARVVPSRFVAKSGGSNRVGRIFVDYLRNGHGQTTVSAFSARSRPGLGVSMPIAWDDVAALKSASPWTIANAREHLSFQREDPWKDYWKSRQTLAAAIKRLAGAGKASRRAPATRK